MLKDTNYNGLREAGKNYGDIPSDVETRWYKNGIAIILSVEIKEEVVKEEIIEEKNIMVNEVNIVDVIDTEALSAKELYEICVEKKLKVDKKKDKDYYIAALKNI